MATELAMDMAAATMAFKVFGFELTDEQIAMATSWGVRIAGVLALLLIAWIVAAWMGMAVRRAAQKARIEVTLAKFFGKLAKWAVLVAAMLTCLSVFGVQTTSFAALIGAAGLAVGLAFQGTLSNFAAGVMLLTFRPFKVGDIVNLAGQLGVVDEIELFTTRLNTLDNRAIIIPNSSVFGGMIENITANPIRRVDVAVGTEYSADIDEVRAVLEGVAKGLPDQAEGKDPQVWLDSLGDSAINWQVRVWTATSNWGAMRQETIRRVKRALDEAGIGIPFPQRGLSVSAALLEALRGRCGDAGGEGSEK